MRWINVRARGSVGLDNRCASWILCRGFISNCILIWSLKIFWDFFVLHAATECTKDGERNISGRSWRWQPRILAGSTGSEIVAGFSRLHSHMDSDEQRRVYDVDS